MPKKIKEKISLLGADKFIMALEHHNKNNGSTGNSCQYIIDISNNYNQEAFSEELKNNSIIRWLSKISLSSDIRRSNYWKISKNNETTIELKVHNTEFNLNSKRIRFNTKKAPLFSFEVFNKNEKTKTIVFTWHHLLMDAYGANLLIRNLMNPIEIQPLNREKSKTNWPTLLKAIKSKRFITRSAKGRIAKLPIKKERHISQNISLLQLSKDESRELEINAKQHGARIGTSSYFIAASSLAVNNYRIREGLPLEDFWIPIPINNRKKGESWPILGNHISFLFYRLKKEDLTSIKSLIHSINEQMIDQIKNKKSVYFTHLMNYLRHFNSSIYSKLIKGPNGESLSSFLITIPAENNNFIDSFFGSKITNQLSIPPNIYPPGLTFSFNYFNEKLSITIQSYTEIINNKEIEKIKEDLTSILLERN